MENNHKFINPYNFIPLSQKCKRISYHNEQTYSGYISCELQTLTPLIMIDSSQEQKEEHAIYEKSFMLKGKPAIPASELRGMIRNKFEILTNSCLASAQKELSFFGRHNGNMRNPGLLDFSDPQHIKLYACKKYKVEKYHKDYHQLKNYKTGSLVSFNIKQNRKKKEVFICSNGSHQGYVKIGETFRSTEAIHIFEIEKEETNIENQNDLEKMYIEICKTYENNLEKVHNTESDGKYRPVWYEKAGNYVYFSLGQNGQTKNKKRLKDLVDESYLACQKKEALCEACSVFGTVQNDLAIASKVRFEDAYLIENNRPYYATKKPITLDELSSPNYQNALFYMRLYEDGELVDYSTQLFWNVDFKSRFSMKQKENQFLNNHEIQIRGRKQYWHHQPDLHKKVEQTKRNVSVIPLNDQLFFKFKVYFDDLTESQLEHLHMAICLGNDSSYAHKLGLGKPLGYGSVKIKTKEIIYKDVQYHNGQFQYTLHEYHPQYQTIEQAFSDLEEEQMYAIQHMFDTKFIQGQIVDYPKNYSNGKIYEWFDQNKKNHEKLVLPFADFDYDYIVQEGLKSRKKKK